MKVKSGDLKSLIEILWIQRVRTSEDSERGVKNLRNQKSIRVKHKELNIGRKLGIWSQYILQRRSHQMESKWSKRIVESNKPKGRRINESCKD